MLSRIATFSRKRVFFVVILIVLLLQFKWLSTKAGIVTSYIEPTTDLSSEGIGEPPEPLRRVNGNNYDVDNDDSDRVNAVIIALVRNSELSAMLRSVRELEGTWNHKFNYPWVFFNDEKFTDTFMTAIQAATNAKVSFEFIEPEDWETPEWIDEELYEKSRNELAKEVQYSELKSYHQMCRWNSGIFYKHKALADKRYYWRVEPNVHFFCDIDYDVFGYMADHNKTYGFTINLYDAPQSIASLWPVTLEFLSYNKRYLHENNNLEWLTASDPNPDLHKIANGYSTCHFWSNFEVADLEFWRSEAYEEYFKYLDHTGNFFYERWGDAPVHSVALGLFEDKNKIHWFHDIGYNHIPYFNCPNSPKCKGCKADLFTDGESWLNEVNCLPNYIKYAGVG